MKQPSLDDLMKHVDSKYTLVVAAAKGPGKLPKGCPNLLNPILINLFL